MSDEEIEEFRLAKDKVEAFLQWDLSHETVDVALQVGEMLEKVKLDHGHGPKAAQISDERPVNNHDYAGDDETMEAVEGDGDTASRSDDAEREGSPGSVGDVSVISVLASDEE